MRKVLNVVIAVAMLALAGGLLLAQSGNDLFQQALVKERTEGNLQEAIKLYQTIVQKYGSDHKLAAKALFQIGQAYEKLGNAEAKKAYERIARDFGDQKDVAADAGRRLATLSSVPQSEQSAPRLVVTGSPAEGATLISRDGRWMTMTEWSTDTIAIRDMSTGQIKRLTASPGNDLQHSVLSPDLRHAAYLHYIPANDEAQLRVIDNEADSTPRVLLRANSEMSYFEPSGWSSDGKSILVTISKSDDTWEIAWVSASDGSIKHLRSLGWRLPRGKHSLPSLSADGKFIAYSAFATNPSKFPPAATDPTDEHIYVLAADGSSEVDIVKAGGINDEPVWTPDGAHVLFVSNRSGNFDLYSASIPDGRTEMLQRNVGRVTSVGTTHSGEYFYAKEQDVEQIRIAEMDLEARNIKESRVGAQAQIGLKSRWSPDGKFLAFLRHREGSASDYDVVVHSLETAEEKVFKRLGIQEGPPLWFHDSKSLLIMVRHENGTRAPYRIDRNTGKFTQILPESLSYPPNTSLVVVSADDKTVFVPNGLQKIVKFDLGSERAVQTIELPNGARFYALSLSPDNRTLAMWSPEHVARIEADGSGYRELDIHSKRSSTQVGTGNVAWTSDSRTILFQSRHNDSWQIMRISAEGGQPEFTGLEVDGLVIGGGIDVSPDGGHFAYSRTKRTFELWSISLSSLRN